MANATVSVKQDPKVVKAWQTAKLIADFLLREAEACPFQWAALIMWSPKSKKLFAIPSWLEEVEREISPNLYDHEWVPVTRGNVHTSKQQKRQPNVPVCMASFVEDGRLSCRSFPKSGFSVVDMNEEITACMEKLVKEIERMNKRSSQMDKLRAECRTPLQAGDVMDNGDKKATVLKASGEWATVQVGKAKPVRRKVVVDEISGPYVVISSFGLYDRFYRRLETAWPM